MKYRLIIGIPFLALGLLLWRCAWHTVTEPVAVEEPTPVVDLVAASREYLPGTVIRPKTTADLRAWFSEASRTHMPRVFVDKLPDDFAEKGDPALFIQVIASLIMRENEQALRERVVLLDLNKKHTHNIPWTEEENLFFKSLVDKYDVVVERKRLSQLAALITNVDEVPVSMAVAMAAEATDWGKKNMDHPFNQQGWIDAKTYGFLPFDSLIDATRSYFRELNGMPPLFEWRLSRDTFRGLTAKDKGYRFLSGLKQYMPWDDAYINRVRAHGDDIDVIAVDALRFLPVQEPISFTTGKTIIKTKTGEHIFETELAETPEQRSRGLMFRTELADNAGMTFINDGERPIGLWMKNTLVPLDMVFFNAQGVITTLVENAQPHDETVRMSDGPALGVTELPAGTVKRLNITPGDTLTVTR